MNKKKSPPARRNWSARSEGQEYYSKPMTPRYLRDRSKYTGSGELKEGKSPGTRREKLPALT